MLAWNKPVLNKYSSGSMTIKLTLLVSFLLSFMVADAFSQPNEWRQGERDAVRAFHAQYADSDRGGQSNSPQAQRSGERSSGGGNDAPENAGSSNRDNSSGSSSSSSRRTGKLSEEERRALRRQIDEAGHDIYSRKR